MKFNKRIASVILLSFGVGLSVIAKSSSSEESKANQSFPDDFRVSHVKSGKVFSPVGAKSVIEMYPSWMGCSRNIASTEELSFSCTNCTVTFSLSLGTTEDGGHTASSHTGTRPKGELTSHLEGVAYSIVGGTLYLTYQAPDTAGEVTLNVLWQTPGSPAVSQDITIYAHVPNLVSLTGNSSLITFFNINSHPGDGTYMTELAGEALLDALSTYKWHAENIQGISYGNIVTPNSEAASLKYGGLFDIGKSFSDPHCTHREGEDVDIGMSLFKDSSYEDDLLPTLKAALLAFDYTFPKLSESPDASPEDQAKTGYHWHAHFNN